MSKSPNTARIVRSLILASIYCRSQAAIRVLLLAEETYLRVQKCRSGRALSYPRGNQVLRFSLPQTEAMPNFLRTKSLSQEQLRIFRPENGQKL